MASATDLQRRKHRVKSLVPRAGSPALAPLSRPNAESSTSVSFSRSQPLPWSSSSNAGRSSFGGFGTEEGANLSFLWSDPSLGSTPAVDGFPVPPASVASVGAATAAAAGPPSIAWGSKAWRGAVAQGAIAPLGGVMKSDASAEVVAALTAKCTALASRLAEMEALLEQVQLLNLFILLFSYLYIYIYLKLFY